MTISFLALHKGGIIFKEQSTPTLEERAQYHCIQGHERRRRGDTGESCVGILAWGLRKELNGTRRRRRAKTMPEFKYREHDPREQKHYNQGVC